MIRKSTPSDLIRGWEPASDRSSQAKKQDHDTIQLNRIMIYIIRLRQFGSLWKAVPICEPCVPGRWATPLADVHAGGSGSMSVPPKATTCPRLSSTTLVA